MAGALEGILVVSLEQAVAAPTCTNKLADGGARVIKIERPEGDFARHYDGVVKGESSHFVWLNRGKESVVLDLTSDDDKALLEALLAKADVFVQNLKPGAIAKLGFDIARLRCDYPRLITCSISGYGESGPFAKRKAYDLLVQAEVGLASITGSPEAPARVGVSVADIGCGMNAHAAILEALIARGRTGEGTSIAVSLFDTLAEWMTAAVLLEEGGMPMRRIGLSHASIAPYGVFRTQDGVDILISIQNDREWRVFAARVLQDEAFASDPGFATVAQRTNRRPETDGRVGAAFASLHSDTLVERLEAADIAFARVNDVQGLIDHPHLRRITVDTAVGPVSCPAPAVLWAGARHYGAIPPLGAHTDSVRAEFLPRADARKAQR